MDCEIVDNKKARRLATPGLTYRWIEEDIRSKVRDGRLPAGTMLASRHNLAREYSVALSTAQQAVANLIADGTLESVDRRGTFVAQPRREMDIMKPAVGDRTLVRTESVHPTGVEEPASASMKTSGTLGVIATARIDVAAPDVVTLWSRMAIRSLEQVFAGAGGTIHFFDRYPESQGPFSGSLDDPHAIPLSEAIAALLAEGVEALAIVGFYDLESTLDTIVGAVDVEQVPTVYISWHEVAPPLAQVFYDNRYAGYQAAQHLLRKGYPRVIALAPFSETWLTDRIEGIRNAVRHAGLPSEALQMFPAEQPRGLYDRFSSRDSAYRMVQQLLAELSEGREPGKPLAGIIAPNDDTAYAVLQAASDLGLVAGTDYGLVGFDDDPGSCAAGLTTVRPPVEAMGEEAGRLLLRALHGEKEGLQVRLRSHLIPRASTSQRPRFA